MQSAQAKVNFQIMEATNPAELRAAGYLRAQTFYSYPPDRSEYSQRVRVHTAEQMWRSDLARCIGTLSLQN